ncbi:MAG: cell envelope integrity protein CreD [Thiolinea sp.]
MQTQRYSLKFVVIFFLILMLLIPQGFLMGLIGERVGWRSEAYQSIQQSWPGAQTLAGPLLSVPYRITYDIKEKVKDADGTEREVIKTAQLKDTLYVIPRQLDIQSKLGSSMRYRGIYEVPVYSNHLQVIGAFNTQPLLDLVQAHKDKKISFDAPQLSVLVRDQRGIARPPEIKWDNRRLAFKPGSQLDNAPSGMHVKLPELSTDRVQQIPFAFDLELRGMQRMDYALLSENTDVKLIADWPHPKFTGELLPEQREVNEQGFTAQWQASSFSYNVSGALEECRKGQCFSLLQRAVGFELLQPVDVYQQSERSVKYAALFIILTFVVLILFELLKKLRVHPIQYTLVGLALTVFYLLLISLSEHISFLKAYVVAALASTGLLTFYFGAILHSRKLGVLLGSGLLGLYFILYIILQAEDKALLMGSVLIFVVLAVLMLATRNLDWYALTHIEKSEKTGKPDRAGSGGILSSAAEQNPA